MVYVSTKLLSPIFERWWQLGDDPGDRRKANVMPIFKKGKEEDLCYCRLVGLTSVPGQVVKEICLEAVSRHVKVIWNIQNGLTKGNPYLTSLIVLYDGKFSSGNRREAVY